MALATKMSRNDQETLSVFVVAEYFGRQSNGAVYEVKLKKESEEGTRKVYPFIRFGSFEPEELRFHALGLDEFIELKLKTKYEEGTRNRVEVESPEPEPVVDPVFTFYYESFGLPKPCLFDAARLGRSKIYITANGRPWPKEPLLNPKSFVFDTDTLTPTGISPPKAAKPLGTFISAYGRLYYLACLNNGVIPKPSFECYDPAADSWEELPPFSDDALNFTLVGFAVCYGYILISLLFKSYDYLVFAFHIETQTWFPVRLGLHRFDCYPFRGRAVVLDGLLYAISSCPPYQVIAFSFSRDTYGDCFLSKPLPLILKTPRPPFPLKGPRTESLFQVGRQHLCLMETSENRYTLDRHSVHKQQYVCATTFKAVCQEQVRQGETVHVKTLSAYVFPFNINDSDHFFLKLSFTGYEDNEPEEKDCPAKTESSSTST